MRLHNDQEKDRVLVSLSRGELVEIICNIQPHPSKYESLEGRKYGTISTPMGRPKYEWSPSMVAKMSAVQLVFLYNELTSHK